MCCVRKRGREREREMRIRGGWKRQFRRISANGYWPTGRNTVRFSAQDDNNKRLRSVGFKLETRGPRVLGPKNGLLQYFNISLSPSSLGLRIISVISLLLSLFFIGSNTPIIRYEDEFSRNSSRRF